MLERNANPYYRHPVGSSSHSTAAELNYNDRLHRRAQGRADFGDAGRWQERSDLRINR
jgi:hypothetical protein